MWRIWLLFVLPTITCAETKWIQSRSGPIEVYSDAGSKQALEKLGIFEQFRFALGTLVGKPDLVVDPPIRLLILKSPASPAAMISGRDRTAIPLAAESPIPPTIFREATRYLLEHNVARLPDETERALETFFSTIDVHGVHVQWGAPPPAAERTREWARIQLLATNPEYYGKLKIVMFNLQKGIADDPAYRNAIGKTKKEFDDELDAYLKAGQFGASTGPDRPMNALRDFPVKPLDSADADLAMADLLNEGSRAAYQRMLSDKRRSSDANEGLAMLALRDKDEEGAMKYLTAAVDAGTNNARIWLAYAKLEPDRPKSNEAIDQALHLDSKLAEAHYIKGERRHNLDELKTATTLEPRRPEYWNAMAEVYLDDNKFPEAAKAYRAAEQASLDPVEKERMHTAWSKIEGEKLDYQDSEMKRAKNEKQQDIDRVKAKSLAELHAAEAKVNRAQGGLAGPPPIAWDEAHGISLEGMLERVECLGKQTRVSIETTEHIVMKLMVVDRADLACGTQKTPRKVNVEYFPKADPETGTAGSINAISQ